MIKKYLKKDIYLQKKCRKLLMELMELMEYQNIIKLLSNTPNQPSKFKEKNCVEIIDE